MASALIGCDARLLRPHERALRAICGLITLVEFVPVQIVAYIIGIFLIIAHRRYGNRPRGAT